MAELTKVNTANMSAFVFSKLCICGLFP